MHLRAPIGSIVLSKCEIVFVLLFKQTAKTLSCNSATCNSSTTLNRELSEEPMVCESVDEHKLAQEVYEQMLMEGAPPELTAEEISSIVSEFTERSEDSDYELFLLYAYENASICPYCYSVMTYQDGRLYCAVKGCLNMQFAPDTSNIADIAWQMKTANDLHKYFDCLP
eukprot:TRINITY_DN8056_c0_g2_i2.p1 TRINITY_DN8056_c0_g2~~TRINITY_DN8056_c0_g2_i2.p1  ORF type:complete len:169 (+),score=27.35 TRINITY_DN8056_c0_g2_i2:164-670(+)